MITVQQSTFNFLKDIEKNNNREWFTDNKPAYVAEQKKLLSFYTALEEKLNEHDTIEKLKMFRIYRDVRFSKNKTPYKTNMSGHFIRATNRLRGGYYLEIRPGASFVAGGFWGPNKEDLLRIRKEFELDGFEIREVLADKIFKENFGELRGDGVKTAPRGFEKEHENIDLIRKKQFILVRNFTDKEVLSVGFMDEVNASFIAMRPFLNLMSSILTTDLNGESLFDSE
ncbi:MAG: TIGR02453 family protein [Flavobacteriaceae bacterium]|nr:MAG: TIGR02453 family protein [Flavobacteriaceae bacterium]